jgi:hypothetical protein
MSRDGYYYRREIASQKDLSDNTHWVKTGDNIRNKNLNGLVGIGKTNPAYSLDISGDLHISKRIIDNINTSGNSGQVLMTTGTGIRWNDISGIGIFSSVYGSFTSDISQSLVGGNSTVLTYNRAEISNNCYHSGGSIYVQKNGVYKISYSIQFDQGSANQHHPVYVFIRVNGSDVPRSTSKWVLRDKDSETVAFTEYILPLNSGQYFEIVFYTDSNGVVATAFPANAQYPLIPSIITNVYSLTTSP